MDREMSNSDQRRLPQPPQQQPQPQPQRHSSTTQAFQLSPGHQGPHQRALSQDQSQGQAPVPVQPRPSQSQRQGNPQYGATGSAAVSGYGGVHSYGTIRPTYDVAASNLENSFSQPSRQPAATAAQSGGYSYGWSTQSSPTAGAGPGPGPGGYQPASNNGYGPSAMSTANAAPTVVSNPAPAGAVNNSQNKDKRPRACEECRSRKGACHTDPNDSLGRCTQCVKKGQPCVVTERAPRKSKKTDQLAELEQRLDAMNQKIQHLSTPQSADPNPPQQAAFASGGPVPQPVQPIYPSNHPNYNSIPVVPAARGLLNPGQPYSPISLPQSSPMASRGTPPGRVPAYPSVSQPTLHAPGLDTAQAGTKRSFHDFQSPKTSGPGDYFLQPRRQSLRSSEEVDYVDVISRGDVSEDVAYQIFERYRTEMAYHLPFVVFPDQTTALDIRTTKPLLFLAILSAASGTIFPTRQEAFNQEALQIIGKRVVEEGDKSLELVQSLQILTLFYQPPSNMHKLHFNHLAHMAATLAFDIGLGKRIHPGRQLAEREFMKTAPPNPAAAESRRAWLGVYFLCVNCSMALRRPLQVRWSAYMDESIAILRSAPDALPSDQWLILAVQAQHLIEKALARFGMDDGVADVDITQPMIQSSISALEADQAALRTAFAASPFPSPLADHIDGITELYLHETGLHSAHNIEDFRAPFLRPAGILPLPSPLPPFHAETLQKCTSAAIRALRAFARLAPNTLPGLPTLFFVRTAYAASCLVRVAVSLGADEAQGLLAPAVLRVDDRLVEVAEVFGRATKGREGGPPMMFERVIRNQVNWFRESMAAKEEKERAAREGGEGEGETAQERGSVGETVQMLLKGTGVGDGGIGMEGEEGWEQWISGFGEEFVFEF